MTRPCRPPGRSKTRPRCFRTGRGAAEHRLRGAGAKHDDDLWRDQREFAFEPRRAGANFADIRLLVQAALAARLEFEVLHRIGDVGAAAVEAGFRQRAIEKLARRPDERAAGEIFLVARLFADEQNRRGARPFAENGLRRRRPERAGAAFERVALQLREVVGGFGAFFRSGGVGVLGAAPHGGLCRSFGDHLLRSLLCAGEKRRDQLRLWEIVPEALRHLRPHGLRLRPRGIEDAGVVTQPHALEFVFSGRIGAGRAGTEDEFASVPMRRALRRQNRPDEIGEAPRKERRRRLDDVVVRLVPGDEMLALVRRDGAEAHESVHLVDVTARPPWPANAGARCRDRRRGRAGSARAANARGCGRADRSGPRRDAAPLASASSTKRRGTRNSAGGEVRRRAAQRRVFEQARRGACRCETHVVRRHIRLDQRTGMVAPAGEVGLVGENDPMRHRARSSVGRRLRGLIRPARLARSMSRVGR